MTAHLVTYAGKRWGTIAAILTHLPRAARVTAELVQGWIRAGKIPARRAGRLLVVALEDVQDVEAATRQTRARRGGRPRGHHLTLAA